MRVKFNHAVIIAGLLLVLAGMGCASGVNTPLSPDVNLSGDHLASSTNNSMLWGLWDVTIDPESGTAEIEPLRSLDFTANVTQFMQQPAAPKNLLGIKINPSTNFTTGYVNVDVTFTHPFPGLDVYTGFDVRGVCLANASITGIADAGIMYAGPDDLRVLNADGLTRWFNPSEFTSYGTIFGFTIGKLGTPSTNFTGTLNGYKYFCDGLDTGGDVVEFFDDVSCPNSRGMFSAGNSITRNYELQFPMAGGSPVLNFQYAVVAGWEQSEPSPPQVIPDDFPVSANCHEAYVVSVADESDLFYVDPGNNGGTLALEVRIFDHQGAAIGDVASQVSAIHLETPGGEITTGGLATFDTTVLASAFIGQDALSATWRLEVTDIQTTQTGEFPVLVAIENADPVDYDSGFPGFAFPIGNLAAYLQTYVTVTGETPDLPPVAVAEIVTSPPFCPDDPIEFDASGSYDQDQGGVSIVSWEWDFDGDGVYGDAYDSGTQSNPVKIYTEFGTYEIDLLVTDNEGDTDTLDELLTVNVGGATWVDDDAVVPYDGSFDHPWPTIQQGIDNATGDCGQLWVLVKDGTYEEEIMMASDMTVEGWSDPAPLITTPAGSANIMVRFNCNIATLKHFRAQPRTTAAAISVSGTGNMVDDIEFLDNPSGATCQYAVTTSGTNHTVNDVRVDGYSKSAAGFIYMNGAGSKLTNCVVLNLTFTAAGNMNVYRMYQGGTNSLMAKNVVGHITFSSPFASTQWANIVNFEYCAGSTFRNNLIFDIVNNLGDTGWTWGIDAYSIVGATFEHNTVSGISGPAWIYAFEVTQYNTDPGSTVHRDHIVTDLVAGTMNWRWAYLGNWSVNLPVDYSCTYSVGNSFYNQVVQGTGCLINTNPLFVDPGNDDYQVSSSSPCHNTAHDGTDMGAYGGSDPLTWTP